METLLFSLEQELPRKLKDKLYENLKEHRPRDSDQKYWQLKGKRNLLVKAHNPMENWPATLEITKKNISFDNGNILQESFKEEKTTNSTHREEFTPYDTKPFWRKVFEKYYQSMLLLVIGI